jgi:4-hydroxy-3-polyprenylbenzoate decarboxylase
MPYRDLREYIAALERRGLLQTIDEPVCKDTELVPLVRLQFRGLPEAQRKAFWFRNVTDARGRAFEGSVVLGSLGSSRTIYGAALDVEPAAIPGLWARAQQAPLAPVVVARDAAPVKEIVRRAPDLGEGVDAFPRHLSRDDQSRRSHRLRDRRADAASGDHVGEGAPHGPPPRCGDLHRRPAGARARIGQ